MDIFLSEASVSQKTEHEKKLSSVKCFLAGRRSLTAENIKHLK